MRLARQAAARDGPRQGTTDTIATSYLHHTGGDHGGHRLGFVDCNLVGLPDSAWAAANWAEIAEQFGNIVELQKESQPNVVADHPGHPVE